MIFSKVDNEQATIEALLASTEKSFRDAVFAFLALARSAEVYKIIRQYLEQGQYEEIVGFINSMAKPLGREVHNAVRNAGDAEMKALTPKAQMKANKPIIVLSFEPGNPRAAEIIRAQTESLIKDISDSVRQVIYDAIYNGQLSGANPRTVAIEIQKVIGLTAFQNNAVNNYRRLLESGSKEALDRGLRDKRFDNTVRRASEVPLTQEQIDRMVDRYREKYIKYRAETIARTEAGRAISQAQEEAIRQTMNDVGIGEDEVKRKWHTTMDGRQRDSHSYLNGRIVGLNEPFLSSSGARLRYPRDPSAPASETINCRCTLTTHFTQ